MTDRFTDICHSAEPVTDAAIIEREFRITAFVPADFPVHVEIDYEAEEIRVWYRCMTFVCDCDNDEMFVFNCLENPDIQFSFAIPADYLLTSP